MHLPKSLETVKHPTFKLICNQWNWVTGYLSCGAFERGFNSKILSAILKTSRSKTPPPYSESYPPIALRVRGLCEFRKGELTRKVEGFRELHLMEGRANVASPWDLSSYGSKKKRIWDGERGRWETRLCVNFITLSQYLQSKRSNVIKFDRCVSRSSYSGISMGVLWLG